MEAVRTSETSVDNHFTRQYNPEDSSEHHTRRRENLKSHVVLKCYGNGIEVAMTNKTNNFSCALLLRMPVRCRKRGGRGSCSDVIVALRQWEPRSWRRAMDGRQIQDDTISKHLTRQPYKTGVPNKKYLDFLGQDLICHWPHIHLSDWGIPFVILV
jgi:hypothetical protein